ncbi:MAG TPA: cobalamin B12-binding domain-containing protein, partial [Polyangiaceae bacterium]|nr:cobalamin B12-binding domain-containing protein [Polyangiaceae bacterium]
ALILDGERRAADAYARDAFDREGVAFLYESIVQPALEEVGELWYANRISTAQEHLATATAEAAVASLYSSFRWPARGPRAIVACAQGERHEFGARMVADLLALDGWDERFVGADVPAEALADQVRDLAPKMLGLSVTLRTRVPVARETIALARAARPGLKVLVGGRAARDAPLGADAVACRGTEAVEVARAWK